MAQRPLWPLSYGQMSRAGAHLSLGTAWIPIADSAGFTNIGLNPNQPNRNPRADRALPGPLNNRRRSICPGPGGAGWYPIRIEELGQLVRSGNSAHGDEYSGSRLPPTTPFPAGVK